MSSGHYTLNERPQDPRNGQRVLKTERQSRSYCEDIITYFRAEAAEFGRGIFMNDDISGFHYGNSSILLIYSISAHSSFEYDVEIHLTGSDPELVQKDLESIVGMFPEFEEWQAP